MRDEAKTWWLVSGPDVASSYFLKENPCCTWITTFPLVAAKTVNLFCYPSIIVCDTEIWSEFIWVESILQIWGTPRFQLDNSSNIWKDIFCTCTRLQIVHQLPYMKNMQTGHHGGQNTYTGRLTYQPSIRNDIVPEIKVAQLDTQFWAIFPQIRMEKKKKVCQIRNPPI